MEKTIIVFLACILIISGFYANVHSSVTEKVRVGEYAYKVYETPHPYSAGSPEGRLVHEMIITHPGASYIVAHFAKLELAPQDYLIVKDPEGRAKHIYTGKGYKNGENFYSLSVPGEMAILLLYSYQERPEFYGYKIDYYAHGYPVLRDTDSSFSEMGIESICGATDWEDAICYQSSHPTEYDKSRASIRLLDSGVALCSAWLISCENHVITNNYCFDSQAGLDDIEFQFMYQTPECNNGEAIPELQLYGGTFLRTSADYDYTLVIPALNGNDPQDVHGYIQVDPRIPDIGEPIIVVVYSTGEAKKISLYSDQVPDTGGVCRVQSVTEASCWGVGPDVGYYCDTAGNSAGSVVLSRNTYKAIALHHCGGCLNSGVPMLDIYNDIQASPTPLPDCSTGNIPDIVYQSNAVTDDCTYGGSGDGDGRLDPGEDAVLSVTLRNDGPVTATNITGVLSTAASGVTITDDTASFLDIPGSGGTGTTQSPHYSIHVSTGIACGTVINFSLDVTYTEGSENVAIQVTVGEVNQSQSTVLSEDFTGTGGWPVSWTVIDGGTSTDTWTDTNPGGRTATAPIAEPFVIVDSDYAGGGIEINEELITPQVNFGSFTQSRLEFDHYFYQYQTEICDVDVRSSNTSDSWVNKLRIQGASSPDPEHKVIDITAEAAGASNAQVRFHYYNAIYEWYWMVDNIQLIGTQTNCLYTFCAQTLNLPGKILNSLTVSKSSNDLVLNWNVPGVNCNATHYGIYRGTLPYSSYDHATVYCDVTVTTYTTAQDTGSYYYLVVPRYDTEEGSYGTDSSGTERPAASSGACGTQNLTPCN